jgi:hypothetical protein
LQRGARKKSSAGPSRETIEVVALAWLFGPQVVVPGPVVRAVENAIIAADEREQEALNRYARRRAA